MILWIRGERNIKKGNQRTQAHFKALECHCLSQELGEMVFIKQTLLKTMSGQNHEGDQHNVSFKNLSMWSINMKIYSNKKFSISFLVVIWKTLDSQSITLVPKSSDVGDGNEVLSVLFNVRFEDFILTSQEFCYL